MGQRVLVTGSAGNVGTNVIQQLMMSDEVDIVVGIDPVGAHPLKRDLEPLVPVYPFDLRDQAAVLRVLKTDRITAVVHLAAVMGTWVNSNPLLNFEVNLGVSAMLYEACRAAGVHRILYASSKALYEGLEPVAGGWVENVVLPTRPYAIAKFASESLGRRIAEQDELQFVGLRFADFLGVEQLKRPPGRRGAAKTLTKIVAAGIYEQPIKLRVGADTCIDPMYTPDLGRAVTALLVKDELRHDTYNVGAGWPGITYSQMVEACRDRYGSNSYRMVDSVGTVYHSVGTSANAAAKSANRGVLNTSRIEGEIGERSRRFHEFLPSLEADIESDRAGGLIPSEAGEWLEETGLLALRQPATADE